MIINERAAAVALDTLVGPEVRVLVEKLYTLIDEAEMRGYQDGYADARADVPDGYYDGWSDGYTQGIAVATSVEQPVVELPEGFIGTDYYEGDSGDETEYDAEVDNTGDYLPPMQEQNRRPTNPFAWS